MLLTGRLRPSRVSLARAEEADEPYFVPGCWLWLYICVINHSTLNSVREGGIGRERDSRSKPQKFCSSVAFPSCVGVNCWKSISVDRTLKIITLTVTTVYF